MTRLEMENEEQRREIARLNKELAATKDMLKKLSRHVPEEIFASIALEMSEMKRGEED